MWELNSCISARFTAVKRSTNFSPRQVRGEFAARETLDGFGPGDGQRIAVLFVGIAGEHRRRLELALQSMQHAGEHPGEHEVRIRIRAGQAMFDAQVVGVGGGHADRRAAVVDRPGGVQRHIGLGAKPPVGIRTGRAHRHAVAERRQRAGDHVAQRRCCRADSRRRRCCADSVEQAHVDVQAAAGHVAIGLRQEGGLATETHAPRSSRRA